MSQPTRRRHGPAFAPDGTVAFRLWAPHAERVHLHLADAAYPLAPDEHGWHVLNAPAGHGDRYGFSLDGHAAVLPDPASRRQPDGVHGRSALVDPRTFRWSPGEAAWRPPPVAAGVVYELHIGTFTEAGTFAAATERLADLRDLGVTHVEVMPVNVFNGPRGWGYDGVGWYAVHEPYGGPDGFASLVDACHRHGLAVVLDVVHNHLGPSGNYLPEFGPYLAARDTGWGDGLNLDGPGSDAVRSFIVGNALAWLTDYHVDALRLDAVHALVDTSAVHILAELSSAVDALGRQIGKRCELIAESDRNDPQTVRPREAGGLGLDAQWADDLHHAIHVALTGEQEGYYADYTGLPDVAAAYTRGFVHDGARYSRYRGRTPGAPLGDVPGTRLVGCTQNHDQCGNRAFGERLTTLVDADGVRVGTLLLCAAPHVPLLFMGEEHGETNPFLYFSAHPEPDLAEAVRSGRAQEFEAFADFKGRVPDPQDRGTFEESRIDWRRADTAAGRARRALWADLLAARRAHPALGNGRRDLVDVRAADAARLALLRRDPGAPPVALAANLGDEPAAFPELWIDDAWHPVVDTGDARYGGPGGIVARAGPPTLPARRAVLWART